MTSDVCDELDKLVWLIELSPEITSARRMASRRLEAMIERGLRPDPAEVKEYLGTRDLPGGLVHQLVRTYRGLLEGKQIRGYVASPN